MYEKFEWAVNMDDFLEKKAREKEIEKIREEAKRTVDVIIEMAQMEWDRMEIDRVSVNMMLLVAHNVSKIGNKTWFPEEND